MGKDLENRVALVTGAGGGIGRAVCLELAGRGASVVVTDRDRKRAEETGASIRRSRGIAEVFRLDVTNKEEIKGTIHHVVRKLGRLDILVNTAGVFSLRPIEEITEAEWDRVIDINLKGTFLCSQAVFPRMKTQKSGAIVNLSSTAARLAGMATPGVYNSCIPYAASKAAIEILTKSMAYEGAAFNIRVNAVAPGPVETTMVGNYSRPRKRELIDAIPLGRFGQPKEIALAIAFLVSDRANYITAKVLDINGGLLMD